MAKQILALTLAVAALATGGAAHATGQEQHLGRCKMSAITNHVGNPYIAKVWGKDTDDRLSEYLRACMQAAGYRFSPRCAPAATPVGTDMPGPSGNPACYLRQ
jgi:hypothetical protein